jgi:hypothetical protein
MSRNELPSWIAVEFKRFLDKLKGLVTLAIELGGEPHPPPSPPTRAPAALLESTVLPHLRATAHD